MASDLSGEGSEENKDSHSYKEFFPVLGFMISHPFEIFALLVSVIGILGYAAGDSFYQGWNSVAGISSYIFSIGTYEKVIKGLSLASPWIYCIILLIFAIVLSVILGVFDEWYTRRSFLVKIRRRSFEKKNERQLRYKIAKEAKDERAILGILVRNSGPLNLKWKGLAPRGNWRIKSEIRSEKIKRKIIRNNKYVIKILGLVFYLVIVGVLFVFYFVLKNMIIKPANKDGAREYVGIYLAVTGKLPTQFSKNSIDKKQMLELACDGYHELWKYRFSSINDAEVDGGSGSGKYILQGGDKIFFLLGSEGSSIYSFGSKNFVLNEAYPRKYSDLVKDCKD